MNGNGNQMKLDAGLLGAAGAALWWWNQDAQQQDNQIRQLKSDTAGAQQSVTALKNSADWIRMQAPTVRDWTCGIAAATPASQPSQTVPVIVNPATRQDLTSGANIPNLTWPPTPGVYDPTGRTSQVGQLGLAAYVQTYAEPQAWSQGLTLAKAPTPNQALQIFYAAQALSAAIVANPNWTQADWQSFWKGVFIASAQNPAAPPLDPHMDPSKPPTATPGSGGGLSVVPLMATAGNTAYNNPQTDAANRWRITSNNGSSAGDTLAHVNFGTEYKTVVGPFAPIVVTNYKTVQAVNITSQGFDLQTIVALAAGFFVDIFVATIAGVAQSS